MSSSGSSGEGTEDENYASENEEVKKSNENSCDSTGSYSIVNTIEGDFGLKALDVDSALLTFEELNSPDNEVWIVTTPKNVCICV